MKSDNSQLISDLTDFFSSMVTSNRLSVLKDVVDLRTRYISVVLENIYQPHNASAVIRSMDCFGVQDLHVIEKNRTFRANPEVSLGASRWISIRRYRCENDGASSVLEKLRSRGYRIVCASPHARGVELHDFDLSEGRAAIVLGAEMEGISCEVMDAADAYIHIPMAGFTESFNVSVAAALILYDLTRRLRSSDISWHLPENEKRALLLAWLMKSVRRPKPLFTRFCTEKRIDPERALQCLPDDAKEILDTFITVE